MSKVQLLWSCAECGHNQVKWSGQCPSCNEWNTLHEEASAPTRRFEAQPLKGNQAVSLNAVNLKEAPRHKTGMGEVDRLVGGGFVHGSLSLVGGERCSQFFSRYWGLPVGNLRWDS